MSGVFALPCVRSPLSLQRLVEDRLQPFKNFRNIGA